MLDNRGMHRLLLAGALAGWLGAAEPVSFERHADRIEVKLGGQPFTALFFSSAATKPYLHPLRAADGTVVTRSYPMEEVPGEQTDHPHHRGVWFGHGDVNGVDFWANEPSQRTRGRKGLIVLEAIEAVEKGQTSGRIQASFRWNAPDGETLVRERRTMRFRQHGEDRSVDFDIVLTAEARTVHFGDTKEGTFAVRMATELEEPQLEEQDLRARGILKFVESLGLRVQHYLRNRGVPRTGRITNSAGHTSEASAWGKRALWVDYAGSIVGKPLGVAIFDHPDNPKHPTYWHVRGYGLFAANIFGERDFHADESRNGGITLAAGETLRFVYRVLVHPGSTAEADIARKYTDWAASPSAASE